MNENLWFNVTVAGNELWRIVTFCGVILLSLVLGRLGRMAMERQSESGGEKPAWWRILLKAAAKPVVLAAFALGLALGLRFLVMPEGIERVFAKISEVLNAVALGYAAYSLVEIADVYLKRFSARTESRVDDVLAPLVAKSIRVTVAVVVLLNVLQVVMEEDMTTILASLGVGGLAIALAGQDTIRNFFGAFVILGDKPFEIGDRVVFEGHDGPVESVGFRSTRIRTLEGHLVTVPNSELVNKTVQNIGKRPHIRRIMNISVTYDTPAEKLERAVEIVREILADHEGMDPEYPPRVYFNEFHDYYLNIIAIYWYHPPSYWDYFAFSERVNFDVLRRFNQEGIEFAFPTQTLYVEGNET